LEAIKRKMAEFRTEFGMSYFLEQETVRAEFEGEWVLSPVSGKLEEVFPFWQAVKRKLISGLIVIVYILCAISAVVGIFVLRRTLAATTLPLGTVLLIAGVVNGVQIQIFNFIYGKLSVGLNEWENHRTDSQYENYLISKAFFFKMINSFVTFVYIGYFKRFDSSVGFCKGSWELFIIKLKNANQQPLADLATSWVTSGLPVGLAVPPPGSAPDSEIAQLADIYNNPALGPDYRGDCFGELAYQLFIIFGMMIFVNNAIEILGPVVGKYLQNRAQTKAPGAPGGKDAQGLEMAETKTKDVETPSGPVNEKLAKITDPTRQSDAENESKFTQYEGTFADYDELIIQFGFVVLFVVVFPAAPCFALLNNIIEFRLDASKLMEFTRRPHPKGAFDMGTWFAILNFISWVMVVSNTALIVFSSHQTQQLQADYRWISFVVVEHILIGIKLMIEFFVPDVPQDVEERLARQEVIKTTLVDPNY